MLSTYTSYTGYDRLHIYYTILHCAILQVGRLLGKALMDGHVTPVHLVQPLYKHLMGWPVSLRDIEQIDDQLYRYVTTHHHISLLPIPYLYHYRILR